MTSTAIAVIYRPNEFHRDSVMHRSNHDPLWLHKFGQPGYVTPIDYGQHVARERALQAAYVASGRAGCAVERYVVAQLTMRQQRKAAIARARAEVAGEENPLHKIELGCCAEHFNVTGPVTLNKR